MDIEMPIDSHKKAQKDWLIGFDRLLGSASSKALYF
jgi:hypothetical protein